MHLEDEAPVRAELTRAARRLWSNPRPTPDHTGRVARWLEPRLDALRPPPGPDPDTDARTDDAEDDPVTTPDPRPTPPLARRIRRLLRDGSPLDDAVRTLMGILREADHPDDVTATPDDLAAGWAGIDRLVARLGAFDLCSGPNALRRTAPRPRRRLTLSRPMIGWFY